MMGDGEGTHVENMDLREGGGWYLRIKKGVDVYMHEEREVKNKREREKRRLACSERK